MNKQISNINSIIATATVFDGALCLVLILLIDLITLLLLIIPKDGTRLI